MAKEIKKKVCSNPECGKELALTNFYVSKNPLFVDGYMPICKKCIRSLIDYNKIDSIYNLMRQLDIPFLYELWENCESKKGDTLGNYIKQLNLPQNAGMRWKHSVFKSKDNTEENGSKIDGEEIDTKNLKEKYGYGYPDDEYMLFEKKYIQLRPSFQLLTTMHEECLREYCIDKVKEGLAKAKGDFKEAKEWAAMAKDVANSGKLNPSQMSKADLSGGMDTFGQLSRMVEQTPEGEMMQILPMFMQKPKDKVDITLLHYINYVRDLKGLKACEYNEIYEFLNKRALEYETNTLDEEIKENMKDTEENV